MKTRLYILATAMLLLALSLHAQTTIHQITLLWTEPTTPMVVTFNVYRCSASPCPAASVISPSWPKLTGGLLASNLHMPIRL